MDEMTADERTYISPKELAELFGIPLKTIYTWNSEMTGPPFAKTGKYVRYLLSDVHTWFDSRIVAPR
jgi:predicted DNA-binding transcriptional regulator AlpA